ncbi:DUF1593 domain-containing protein [Algoriphagus yeomjeoni]|uniref:DUF1593 domain-containing protein n=1 Tax=Algoriphagus yeomjeoni TaxID=291403 RepID=UPI003CE4DA77
MISKNVFYLSLFPIDLLFFGLTSCQHKVPKNRIIVSTDIGGSDPDDYQSLVHLFLYADTLEIVGIVSSPPYEGRKEHILEVIDAYKKDYPKLIAHSKEYPSPKQLRSVSAQGAIEPQEGPSPTSDISEGAKLIVEEAKKKDSRPLYVLVWGSLTDVAQALHFSPEIKDKIRVYAIGSWNTVQDTNARNYIFEQHPDLWFIENNTTFRGMYMGGYQEDDYGNETFVSAHIKDHGTLGDLFYGKKKDIKMGDTPSVLYMLHGDPSDPESSSWGGQFIKTEHGPNYWTDMPDPSLVENKRNGAKTVNKWRKEFLTDWKNRMDILK